MFEPRTRGVFFPQGGGLIRTVPDHSPSLTQINNLLLFFLSRTKDPIFSLVTPLKPEELHSHTRELIAPPRGQDRSSADLGVQMKEAPHVQGGWFGRGYGKGRRKRKKAA